MRNMSFSDSFSDHTCDECSHWDDINGCWAGGPGGVSWDIACEMYDGDDFEEEEYDDEYDRFAFYKNEDVEP